MANLCSNCVIFSGDETALAKVKELFQEIQDQQVAIGKWYLPEYVTADFSNMQELVQRIYAIAFGARSKISAIPSMNIPSTMKRDGTQIYKAWSKSPIISN